MEREGEICQGHISSVSVFFFVVVFVSSATSLFQLTQHTGANLSSDLETFGQNFHILICETLS